MYWMERSVWCSLNHRLLLVMTLHFSRFGSRIESFNLTIFLGTCNTMMITWKTFQVTDLISDVCKFFFQNFQHTRWKLSSRNLLRARNALWLVHFNEITLQVALGMSFRATCLTTSDSSTFLSCNATAVALQVVTMGCYTWNFFWQLPMQRLLGYNCKLQRKLPRVTL